LMDAGFEALPITLPVMRDAGVLSEV
jgi:hypothetical protein